MSVAEVRAQWRRRASGDGPAYLFLPKDPHSAHQALIEHGVQHGHLAAVYPPPEAEGAWTRDVLHALTTGKEPGFSLHDHIGDSPSGGFMVSIDPHDEEIYQLRDIQFHPDMVGDYFDRHASEIRSNPNAYIGAWVWRGQAFLDVSVHTNSADEARNLCLRYNQKAYYDLGTGNTVMVDRRAAQAVRAMRGEPEPPQRFYGREPISFGDQVSAMAREATDFGLVRDLPSRDYNVLDPRPLSPGFEHEDYSFDFIHPQIATGGALHDVADAVQLKRARIQAVIDNRADFNDAPLFKSVGLQYVWNPTADDHQHKGVDWFRKGLDFGMPFLRSGEKVYSHCHSGRNRGPSMAYALLRALTKCSHETAMSAIQRVRPFAPVAYADDADEALVKLGYIK